MRPGARGRQRRDSRATSGAVDWVATLSDPQNHNEQGASLAQFHRWGRVANREEFWLVLLDTSGSLIARGAMAKAKGAVADLCVQAYRQRQAIELIGFGNSTVNTLHAARRPSSDPQTLLATIGSGGGTPLRAALVQVSRRLAQMARRDPARLRRVFIFSDARSRDAVEGLQLDAAVNVIDTEQSAVRMGKARSLANHLNAAYVHIDELPLR